VSGETVCGDTRSSHLRTTFTPAHPLKEE